jgi:hypothetical protein
MLRTILFVILFWLATPIEHGEANLLGDPQHTRSAFVEQGPPQAKPQIGHSEAFASSVNFLRNENARLRAENARLEAERNDKNVQGIFEQHGEKSVLQTQKRTLDDHETPEVQQRRASVVAGVKHAWSSYERFCFGQDELRPLSASCGDWLGMGLMIVDSLDTLWYTGLYDEYTRAKQWIKDKLDFSRNYHTVSVFETTIRSLGGLLSAFEVCATNNHYVYNSNLHHLSNSVFRLNILN